MSQTAKDSDASLLRLSMPSLSSDNAEVRHNKHVIPLLRALDIEARKELGLDHSGIFGGTFNTLRVFGYAIDSDEASGQTAFTCQKNRVQLLKEGLADETPQAARIRMVRALEIADNIVATLAPLSSVLAKISGIEEAGLMGRVLASSNGVELLIETIEHLTDEDTKASKQTTSSTSQASNTPETKENEGPAAGRRLAVKFSAHFVAPHFSGVEILLTSSTKMCISRLWKTELRRIANTLRLIVLDTAM